MSGIKYGFSFFCNNIKTNLLIALEIAMLLVVANSLLGFYNNLSVLYVPYEDILKKEGVLYFDNSYASDYEESISRTNLFKTLDDLKGNVNVYLSYTIPYTEDGKNVQVIHIIDDRIYDKLVYTTSSGSIASGYAIASYLSGYKTGDIIKTESGEIEISGTLTQTTYFPIINACEDVTGMHGVYTSGVDESEFLIMGLSSAKIIFGEIEPFFLSDTILISFDDCSENEIQHNLELLKQNGQIWDLDRINTRTIRALKEQYARFVPFIYIISIAVIIGIISFCIVTSLDNKVDMDILYNCGAGSISLFFVMLGKNLCIVISSVLFSAIALLGMKFTGVFANNGIRLMDNLLPLSALIICACIVMCQLVSTLSNLTFWRKVK
ncbi:MAG: hypothetical protein IJ696_01530 [Ruminococcus sp.]|nr:hypothetical protein [Ruminococcus sp.]